MRSGGWSKLLSIQAVQWSKRPNHLRSQNAILVRNLTFSEKGEDNSVSNLINKSVYFFLFWETLIKRLGIGELVFLVWANLSL